MERLLLWRVWERMLEIEFIDRSVALAGKAFVSFFPLVIVVAAFVPEGIRSSIITAVTARLGIRGDAFALAREAFASSEDIRKATGVLGLVLTVFFATSFTTALQRVYLRAWRAAPPRRVGAYWRGAAWLLWCWCLGAAGRSARRPRRRVRTRLFAVCRWRCRRAVVVYGVVLPAGRGARRVLLPTGVITGIAMAAYAVSASVWMPEVVTSNEAQFGFFGVALSLVTWFSGAALCILVGACAGPVFAEDPGRVGTFVRGGEAGTLTAGARRGSRPPTASSASRRVPRHRRLVTAKMQE